MSNIINLPTYEQVDDLKETVESQFSVDGKNLRPIFNFEIGQVNEFVYPNENYILMTDTILMYDYENKHILGKRGLKIYRASMDDGSILSMLDFVPTNSGHTITSVSADYQSGFCYNEGYFWASFATSATGAAYIVLMNFNDNSVKTLGAYSNSAIQISVNSPFVFDTESNHVYVCASGSVLRFLKPFEQVVVSTTSQTGITDVRAIGYFVSGLHLANGKVYTIGRNNSNQFCFNVLNKITLANHSDGGSYVSTVSITNDQCNMFFETNNANIVIVKQALSGATFALDLSGDKKPLSVTTANGYLSKAFRNDKNNQKFYGFDTLTVNNTNKPSLQSHSYTVDSNLRIIQLQEYKKTCNILVSNSNPLETPIDGFKFKISSKSQSSDRPALIDCEPVYQIVGYVEKGGQ